MARTDFVRVEVRGAAAEGQLARDFDRAQRRIQDRLNRHMQALDRVLPRLYKEFAPRDTGALADSITSRIFYRGGAIRVTVAAEAMRGTFNYLQVTRTGHVQRVIRPVRKKLLAVHLRGRHARPVLRRRVRGYHPKGDWVELASVAAERVVDEDARALSRDIDVILLASARGR